MWALNAFGHPGGAAGVKDGRKALCGIVQPGWWFSSGRFRCQGQDVKRREIAKFRLPPRENDHRFCIVDHMGYQGFGQGTVEEHQRTASLEDAEVRGDDLPVVLGHGHCHYLVGACEEWGKGCGHALGSLIEISECQGLPGVGDVQGGEFRKLLGGAAEDVGEPADASLMGYVDEVIVTEDIRKTALTGIRLPARIRLSCPEIPPPRDKCQCEEGQGEGR
jgi:hypothetical protein